MLRDGRRVEFVDRRPSRSTSGACFRLPTGEIEPVPLTDFDESDGATEAWIDGYLRGMAPTYDEFVGGFDTDEESARVRDLIWRNYLDYLESGFQQRGYALFGYRWPLPSTGMGPSAVDFAWTLVGATVMRWTADGWVVDAEQRPNGLTVLPGSECVRLGHDFESEAAHSTQCSRCGYTDFFDE
jgi:hypothetical protein